MKYFAGADIFAAINGEFAAQAWEKSWKQPNNSKVVEILNRSIFFNVVIVHLSGQLFAV